MDISSDKLAKFYARKLGHILRNRNLKKETEPLRIADQNNAIRTNYVKAKIDNTQQNAQLCRLCGDKNKMINHIKSESSKLTQKEYKTRHEWVGKVIYRELYKKLKSNHMNKSYTD